MFEKACNIAKTMKMADRNTQEFHLSSSTTIQVNKLTEQGKENIDRKYTEQLSCHSCGGSHSSQSCKFNSAMLQEIGRASCRERV